MRKKYLKLLKEQKERNVIFSSQLISFCGCENGSIHEIYKDDKDKYEKIRRLKNDEFFNNSHFKYNLIRQQRYKKMEYTTIRISRETKKRFNNLKNWRYGFTADSVLNEIILIAEKEEL